MSSLLVDMDGVLVDFTGGIFAAHGIEDPYQQGATGYDIANVVHEWGQIPKDKFWLPCDDHEFWANLPWTLDGKHLLEQCEKAADEVYLVTSPTLACWAYSGKAAWVQRHLPNYSRRVLIGGHECRHLLARPGAVLVDDSEKNVQEFRGSGGTAVLVPRPWNSARGSDVERAIQQIWEATK